MTSVKLFRASNYKSFVSLVLAAVALAACEDSIAPRQPTVIHFEAISPTNISGVVGSEVGSVPVVRVTDGDGKPLVAFRVSFRTRDGGEPGNVTALTDNAGVASAGSWRLGPKAGNQTLQAFYNVAVQFNQVAPGDTAVFNAVAKPGPLASLKAVDGLDQFGLTGGGVQVPLRVRAVDRFDNPLPDIPVAFSVLTGNGSIDGTTTVTGSDGEAASGLWTLGPESGTQTARVESGNAQAVFSATACAPNECRVLFTRNGDVYTWDAGRVRRLISDSSSFAQRWSPDGRRIAFARFAEDGVGTGVYVMDADGSNVIQIASGSYSGIAWSPDGAAVAVASTFGYLDILNLNPNPGTPHRVGDGVEPDWSPDGKKLVTVNGTAIDVMNADGSGVVELVPTDNHYGVSVSHPRWSPDGNTIAFAKCDEYACSIYVVDVTGSSVKRLTNDVGSSSASWAPTWSHDGTRIAFTRRNFTIVDALGIYYMPATGGTPKRLIASAYIEDWLR